MSDEPSSAASEYIRAEGRPRFECELPAARGERCAAHVVAVDATLALTRRAVDVDEAMVELDRLHRRDDGISS